MAPNCPGKCSAVAVALVLLFACSVFGQDPVLLDGQRVHPTRLLARAKPGRVAAVPAGAKSVQPGKRPALTPGLFVLDEPPPKAGADVVSRLRQRLAGLRASGNYDYVEPDFLVELDSVPDDAAYLDGRLWGLRNDGQSGGVAGMDVNAAAAWALTTGASNIVVGVIDTGIRYSHQDLQSRMWRNPGEVPGNGLDDDGNGYVDDIFGIDAVYNTGNPFDEAGHGTHVAGTIGAAANNGHPHVGVAPQVRLMACRFIALSSGYTSDAIECIQYAVAHGARILNNSWGSTRFSHALYETIVAANAAGVLFVAAAGNRGRDFDVLPNYPSGYDVENVLSVAALDRRGEIASFSNYGSQRVHLGAPGVDIFSSYAGTDDNYRVLSGTSMASPHVAGVAALVWSHYPGLSMNDVRRRVLAGVTPTTSLLGKTATGGRTDAHRTLTIGQDGALELALVPVGGLPLVPGTSRNFVVQVSDLLAVTNATVTAVVPGVGTTVFENDGIGPDVRAVDEFYSASLVVPTGGSTLTFQVTVAAPGFAPTNFSANFPILVRPSNDDFAGRIFLTGDTVTLSGDNQLATRENGEPFHAGLSGKHSMWWTWTAPANGFARPANFVMPFTFQMAVYSGTTLTSLTTVATYQPLSGSRQPAFFPVNAGQQYHIAVDGFRDGAGSFHCTFSITNALPSFSTNDFFALRQPLTGWTDIHVANNFVAGMEMFEPGRDHASGRTLWWTWTAPGDARITFEAAGANFSVLAAAYLGEAMHDLTRFPLLSPEMTNAAPVLSFNAAAGRSYQFVVDSRTANRGVITAMVHAAGQSRPANDDFAQRAVLTGVPTEVAGALAGATWEHREPEAPPGQGSAWYRWHADVDGHVFASLSGAGTNAKVEVYVGDSLGALTRVDVPFDSTRAGWRAAAGTDYAIRVASIGMEEPAFTLSLQPAAEPVVLLAPRNSAVFAGRTLRLVAETAGALPLAHQWFRGGHLLPGETNATLRLSAVSAQDSGLYSLLVSNALGVAMGGAEVVVQPLTAEVGVFGHTRYIDTHEGLGGTEFLHLEAAVERVGYQPSRITNLLDFTLPALLVPNQRGDSITRGLPPQERAALVEYVRDGGLLIVAGSFRQRDAELLDVLFGFGVAGAESTDSMLYFRTPQADDTPFAHLPDTIDSQQHTTIDTRSLPSDAVSLLQREERTLAAHLRFGDGHVAFLGPTFYGVRPRGLTDGGWLALIEAALRVGAPPLDRVPVFESVPQSRFVSAQSGVTLNVSAFGSSPLSYQWFRGEELLPLGTNAVLALPAGTNQGGFYYAVVSNAVGVTTSDVARVTVTPPGLPVIVFNDPAFVATGEGSTNESAAVQATIRYFGYEIETATNFNVLTSPIVVIPRLANGDLAAALSAAELGSVSNHVAGGGSLILFGDPWEREIGLLRRLFGWELGNYRVDSEGGLCYRFPLPRRSLFRYGPDLIAARQSLSGAYYAFDPGTLPPGSLLVFEDPENYALVADMPWGRGRVIHIGWNWRMAAPLGPYDDNWLLVLAAALAQGWNPEPPPQLALAHAAGLQWHVRGTPLAPAELQWSGDLSAWTSIETNIIPASGVLRRPLLLPANAPTGFLRVREW